MGHPTTDSGDATCEVASTGGAEQREASIVHVHDDDPPTGVVEVGDWGPDVSTCCEHHHDH